MTFASRALPNIAVTLALVAGLALVDWLYGLALRDASFLSGWLLIVGMGLLAVFNVRKKLPFLPLVNASIWLQLHIYIGWLVIALFLLHSSLAWPNGPLEIALWLLFVMVAGSGLLGLVLSRIIPNRLGRDRERIIFERIPVFRAALAREVEELAMRSVTGIGSNAIARYYVTHLLRYFHGSRNLIGHLTGSSEALPRMCREIKSLERYLNEDGRKILDEIEWRVIAKDNLDYQYALQWLLKSWLFVHIPLTYSLLLVAVVHAVLAYAFGGGML